MVHHGSTKRMKFQQMDIARISKPRELFPEGFHKVFLRTLAFDANHDVQRDYDVVDRNDDAYDQIFSLYLVKLMLVMISVIS